MSDGPTFRDELVAAGVLVPTASDGIYGRSAVYEDIVAGLEGLVNATAASEGSAGYRFPPVMPRSVLEQSGYLSSFPDMIGSVSVFRGDNAEHKRLMEVAAVGWRMDVVPGSRRREPVPRGLPPPLSHVARNPARGRAAL